MTRKEREGHKINILVTEQETTDDKDSRRQFLKRGRSKTKSDSLPA